MYNKNNQIIISSSGQPITFYIYIYSYITILGILFIYFELLLILHLLIFKY